MRLSEMQTINFARAIAWRAGAEPWSLLEIAGELCEEAGEAAGAAKKLKRHDTGLVGNRVVDREQLIQRLAEELGDVIIVALRLASEADIDLEAAVVESFNRKSVELGFPQRFT